MIMLNDGKTETCIRPQGTSRVDVTIATEVAAKEIKGWEVDGITETLSDHRYVRYSIAEKALGTIGHRGKNFPKWNVKKRDIDWFTASIALGNWLNESGIREMIEAGDVGRAEIKLKRIVLDACDNSMSREKTGNNARNKVYW